MRVLSIVVLLSLLTACATKVTSIKRDFDRSLGKDKGYLLLGIETNRDLKSIMVAGPEDIMLTSADMKKGTNYILIDLKAGNYTFDKVMLDNYWRIWLDDEDYWTFEVMPNQISYVGHLEIARRGFWGGTTYAELVNRSSEALEFLEENYPTILANRSIAYGGPGDDSFFQFLGESAKE